MVHTPSGSLSSSSSIDLTGTRLGDLQILRRLGRGGMAEVYVARQMSLDRQVAVKVLRSDLATDEAYVRRFEREARAAADLAHPNIVQIFEIGNTQGLHYIAQEFVDGRNLRELVRRDGSLSSEQVMGVLYAVAAALDRASSRGIIHRDIKPENIMLGSGGEVKVADFGLARVDRPGFQSELTQIGLTMGTPLYMSPEQIQGKGVDVRSDLYSLGVTAYYLLAGHAPFEGDSPLSIAVKHLNDAAKPLDEVRHGIPAGLVAIVEQMMRKDPAHRIQTPLDLMRRIESVSGRNMGPIAIGSTTLAPLPATARLQELMGERSLRGGIWRKGLIAAGVAVAAWGLFIFGQRIAKQRPMQDSFAELRATPVEVSREESVESQYFAAMALQTREGWLAVAKYFPPGEKSSHVMYAEKAALQLARLERGRNQWQAADEQLRPLLNSKSQVIVALAFAEQVAMESGQGSSSQSDSMSRLQSAYRLLSDQDRTLVRTAAPEEVAMRLVD
jgi:eukaryotic-like serine/threonine-protein kinase